jgi:hypothetical protein
LGDHAASAGGAGEGDLGDALAVGQRHAGFAAKAVDYIEHTGRQQVGNQINQNQDGDRSGFGGLEHHAIACTQGWGKFPGSHEDGEVPGDDLTDHTQRLVNVIRHGVFVDLADTAFLGAHAASEVAEMVHGQRDVGIERLANRFAVVHGLSVGQHFEVLLNAVSDLEQDVGPRGGIGLAPLVGCGMSGIQCQIDVCCIGSCSLRVHLAVDGGDDVKVLALDRSGPLAANEVVVLGFVLDLGTSLARGCINHGCLLRVGVEIGEPKCPHQAFFRKMDANGCLP